MNLANPVWQREPFDGPRIEEPELVANEVDCWCMLVFQSGLAKKIQKVHQLAGHDSFAARGAPNQNTYQHTFPHLMKRCACVKPVSKNILHPISAVAYDSERKRQRHGMHQFHIRSYQTWKTCECRKSFWIFAGKSENLGPPLSPLWFPPLTKAIKW